MWCSMTVFNVSSSTCTCTHMYMHVHIHMHVNVYVQTVSGVGKTGPTFNRLCLAITNNAWMAHWVGF